jgi:hypothetical protein
MPVSAASDQWPPVQQHPRSAAVTPRSTMCRVNSTLNRTATRRNLPSASAVAPICGKSYLKKAVIATDAMAAVDAARLGRVQLVTLLRGPISLRHSNHGCPETQLRPRASRIPDVDSMDAYPP